MPFDNTTYLEPAADPEVVEQPDPYSLDTFIAWLETMPAEGRYDYDDCQGGCLIGLYAAAQGVPDKWHEIHQHDIPDSYLWPGLARHFGHIAAGGRSTYGTALEYARTTRADIDALLEEARL